MKKRFWPIFPILSNMTYVKKLFLGSASSFDYYCGTYKSIFFGLERLLKTQFLKKKATLPVKKKLTSFNSYYRLWQTSRNNLQESTSHSYQYCINYSNIFLGPKMLLKTQIFEKKGKLFTEKKFWCRFFSFYRVWQSSGDMIEGSTSFFHHCFIIHKSIF